MRWATDRRARLGALLLLLLLAACTADPSPSAPSSASQSAPASAQAQPEPGQPYTAADILEAMRTSPRPDGVPEQLQTDAIAAAIADAIWTFDGQPWDDVVVDASCGEATCQVDVAGTRAGADGEDLWTFTVTPADETVTVETAALRAVPPAAVESLDGLVRGLLDPAELDGMALTSAAWEPPPGEGRFTLAYRSGGEEGSCGLDLVVDPAAGEIVDRRTVGTC